MPRHYRALISVPITAKDDDDAVRAGGEYAGSLQDAHLELLGELPRDAMEIARVVLAEPHFIRQLPADWKP